MRQARHTITAALALVVAASCSGSILGDPGRDDGSGANSGSRAGSAASTKSSSSTPGASSDPGTPAPSSPASAREDGVNLPSASLFACKPGARSASAPRIWRLSGTQYANTVKALIAGTSLMASHQNPFTGVDSDQRFKNYSVLGMPEAVVGNALQAASDVADEVTARAFTATPCLATPDAPCVRGLFEKLGPRAYRRPLAADELTALVNLVTSNVALGGARMAVSLGVQALLMSPHFLYRLELGDDNADASGLRKLTPYEVASALSYTLADAPPDDMLMNAAGAAALAAPEQVRPHALRLLGKLADSKPMATFLREYLYFPKAADVFKDAKTVPNHAPKDLIADTEATLRDLLVAGKDFLPSLLTSRSGYARKATANYYGVTVTASTAQKFDFEGRAGYLTQPSFLTAFSHADENDPIARGKFIAKSLLCLPLPATPPPNVPPLPENPNATMREKLSVHRESVAACASCHNLMDPLGLTLEGFDHVGRARTTEIVKSGAAKPVITTGAINGTGTSLDGPVSGPVELAQKLAGAPAVEQCFVRHSFRFWFGRNETEADACSLAEAHQAFKRAGGDPTDMIVALVTSGSFLYRTGK